MGDFTKMIDIKLIRAHKQEIEKKLKTKEPSAELSPIVALDERIRVLKMNSEELKSSRNHLSKEIGEKKRRKEDTAEIMAEVAGLGDKIAILDKELADLETELTQKLACMPNLPRDEVKVSLNKEDNVCIKTVGQKRDFKFSFKNHVELNDRLHLFDFKRAAKTTGSGWPAYRDLGAH